MNRKKISEIIGNIDEKYIDEATAFASDAASEKTSERPETSGAPQRIRSRFRWEVLAACLVLFAVVGSTAMAIAAEAEEYGNALAFFEENGLSTEGLSRSEVKAVYRDITENKFSYDKTAEVIQRAVPGLEIEQSEPTPEDLENIWNNSVWMNTVPEKGKGFSFDYQYVRDETRGFDVLAKSVLQCFQDGQSVWSTEFEGLFAEDCLCTEDGISVWGFIERWASADRLYAWFSIVDSEGEIKWQKSLDHGFDIESIASVLNNGDGTWAVISRGDTRYLCLSIYDADGNETLFNKTEVGNLGIWNVARLGDGYIVQLGNLTTHDTALLYKMDRDGNITDSFSYEAEDCDYRITDMAEFGGHVYLSAYAYPVQEDEGGRHEIANILNRAFPPDGSTDITDEALTSIVRDNYTAVLLICDPEDGDLKTFYSVKGSLGGPLAVNGNGELEWDVESIASTYLSLYTSSFTVGGVSSVFRYTFDAEGTLTGRSDTGETVPYRR